MKKDIFTVAGFRGIVTAVSTGALTALGVWQVTNDEKAIVIAGAVPFFTILGARFGIEGTYDANKPAPAPGETAISAEPPLG